MSLLLPSPQMPRRLSAIHAERQIRAPLIPEIAHAATQKIVRAACWRAYRYCPRRGAGSPRDILWRYSAAREVVAAPHAVQRSTVTRCTRNI